jgi:lipoprotein NlpI
MRWLVVSLSIGAVLCARAAVDIDSRLREVISASRTNVPVALRLCDRLTKDFSTNAQPFAVRARLLDRSRRYEEALRDLSTALKLDSKTAELWQARGEIHFKAGHFKESVADFDRFLELSPQQAPYHWQRGISLYYAGRFADGRKQFELHRTVNPNDVENAVWHFLCAARERGVTNARASTLPVGADARVPMTEIYALYCGNGTVEKVISAASHEGNDPRQRDAMFYAHLYLGLFFDVTGEPARAREHIRKAANEFGAEHYMGDVARVHLRTLNATK